MDNIENLTLLQKTAIEGEVSMLFMGVKHDLQLLKRLYLVFSSIPKDVAGYALQITKNVTTFSEEKIDRVLLKIALKEYPEWLWIENIIEDLKAASKVSESEYVMGSNLHVNKKLIKEMTVKSAFAHFCKDVGSENKRTVVNLCRRVLDENDLEFLYTVCTTFIEAAKNANFIDSTEEKTFYISRTLFESDFDPSYILSYRLEKEGIEPKKKAKAKSTPAPKLKHNYEVVKSFKGSDKGSVLITFRSEEEAKDYIENLETNYPELKNTCKFEVREVNIGGTEI